MDQTTELFIARRQSANNAYREVLDMLGYDSRNTGLYAAIEHKIIENGKDIEELEE